MTASLFRLLVLLAAAAAATPVLENVANSAPRPSGVVEVNADCSAGVDVTSARLFYSLDYQSSWTEVPMSRIGAPGFDSTFGQSFAIPGSGAVYYYVRASDGVLLATQSPYNGANVWPPPDNLLALAASDTTGDVQNPEGPYVDLTGAYVGHSTDYFYAKLTNNHTSWPLSAGVLGPWFIYSIGFVNPEAPSDSWVFSLSYADVPFAFSTGLYLINRFTASYSKIAGIDASTSGNKLMMRCRQADMTGHALFGPWPNSSGYLSVAANTQSIRISGATLRDTTVPAAFYPLRTPFMIVGQNRPPSLHEPRVTPSSGTPETEFRFSCRYSDPDSNLPVLRAVVVDSDTLALRPGFHRYWEEVPYDCSRSGFAVGWRRFRFVFDDGMARVFSPPDSFLVSGTGIGPGRCVTVSGLRIGPSPTTGLLNVCLPPGCRSIAVFDAAGCAAAELRPGINDISRLQSGVYFVRPGFGGPVKSIVRR